MHQPHPDQTLQTRGLTEWKNEKMTRRQRQVTIGQRITLAMILLVTTVFAVAGTLVFLVEHRSIQLEVRAELRRSADELSVLALEGVDPDTGLPFDNPSALMETFLTRTVSGPDEGELGVVDGNIAWVATDDVELRPEQDPQLIEALLPLTTGDRIHIDTLRTDLTRYEYLVAPVHFPDSSGALIHVFDMHTYENQWRETILIFIVVAAGSLAITSLLSLLLVRRLLHPVEELRTAAESIDERDLTARVPVRGRDDLTRLSVSINHMLDRVQKSVEGQQKLLDDVGHELRTPITIVRGHLELLDPNDPEDVWLTRELAIEELDRMSALVESLITLAKSRESDFIQPEWFSLGSLTDQTFEKARALGERSWRLERIVSTDAWLDPQRITQAWLQLAANAVKYSADGTVITMGSELVRGEVRLWVRDQGVGIATDQLDVIRERFGRARGTERVEGAGLGLNIVETIVAAHNGRLEIDSRAGSGSTFTIVLPLTPMEEETDEHHPDH